MAVAIGAASVGVLMGAGAGILAAVQSGDPETPVLDVSGFDDANATARYTELAIFGSAIAVLGGVVAADAMLAE